MMYKAIDIANWFIHYNETKRDLFDEDTDEISNLKLQKLLYYAQSAFLAIKEEKLFNEDIEAWRHGPVVPKVYEEYRKYGSSGITEYDLDIVRKIEKDEETRDILANVYELFGEYSAWGLRNLTHSEEPWKTTIQNQVISCSKMAKTFKEKYLEN